MYISQDDYSPNHLGKLFLKFIYIFLYTSEKKIFFSKKHIFSFFSLKRSLFIEFKRRISKVSPKSVENILLLDIVFTFFSPEKHINYVKFNFNIEILFLPINIFSWILSEDININRIYCETRFLSFTTTCAAG